MEDVVGVDIVSVVYGRIRRAGVLVVGGTILEIWRSWFWMVQWGWFWVVLWGWFRVV